jgi:flagellar protein FliO/FliZ
MARFSIRSALPAALALACCAAAAGMTAFAADSPAAEPVLMPGGEFSWWGYIRALGVLVLTLGAVWAAVWFLRRSGRFAGMPRIGSLPRDGLYLERQLGLGPRKGLIVVRFLNRRLLLGVTEHQITLLTETDPDDEPSPPNAATFQECLDNAPKPGAPDAE